MQVCHHDRLMIKLKWAYERVSGADEADRREASAAWIVSMSGHEVPTAP